mmetsp:Transcript_9121/g.27449  ORF Transcript_9121/g.27449 Transcript_9121/m.27449 type:complete len:301 (+) Transcript_9121:152-1054(+)|eukprot:CAMPEP_0198728360 /NCGR_PEP_ID=MMETSP1475-20131203/8737_1 /TAXON_ID= ORGANISM="Unidentified sp., Strain CCMP1999" /NCGR_SAMPLE_ID=MMETSP1475 /ASSEMBLY_ACC=CAM_ASM_001111 /LENGTH=300 /DNA_ID=CAMNT_0044490697 /DNA_START=120 /DNA_END=1022 /DNA_ORIENTATION=-
MAPWRPEEVPDLGGKVAIVTGANVGIGFYTAKHLARRNAHVIIASRNEKRGNAAADAIVAEFPHAKVEFMKLDLASRKSILSFVRDFCAKNLPLHILVNNAGVCNVPFNRTVEGYEVTVGTNHFGTFLLTMSLLDVLKTSAPSRVVTVSSGLATKGKVDFEDLAGQAYTKSDFPTYNNSKLYNVLFAFELEKKLRGSGVHSYAVHPGMAKSEIVDKMDSNMQTMLIRNLGGVMMQSTERGAYSSIYAATSPSLEGKGGLYLGPNAMNIGNTAQRRFRNGLAYDEGVQERLWVETERILSA